MEWLLLVAGSVALFGGSVALRRIPASRPAGGNGACRGLSHRGMRGASSLRMVRLPNTSARGATDFPPPSTVKRWPNASRSDRGSQARRWLRKGKARDSLPTATSGDSIGTNKLTMPLVSQSAAGRGASGSLTPRILMLSYHIGAIKYFICYDSLTRSAA
jgi:hypothetical protein